MSHAILLLPFAALLVINLLPRSARASAWIVAVGVFALQTAAAILQPFGVLDWSFLAPLEKAVGFTIHEEDRALRGRTLMTTSATNGSRRMAWLIGCLRTGTPR